MTSENEHRASNSISGQIHGQNIVIGGTQEVRGNLSIVVGSGAGPDDLRRTLQEQVDRLTAALGAVPAAGHTELAGVTMAAEDAVRETQADRPEPGRLRARAEALKHAAAKLAEIAPAVLEFATQVAATIVKFG